MFCYSALLDSNCIPELLWCKFVTLVHCCSPLCIVVHLQSSRYLSNQTKPDKSADTDTNTGKNTNTNTNTNCTCPSCIAVHLQRGRYLPNQTKPNTDTDTDTDTKLWLSILHSYPLPEWQLSSKTDKPAPFWFVRTYRQQRYQIQIPKSKQSKFHNRWNLSNSNCQDWFAAKEKLRCLILSVYLESSHFQNIVCFLVLRD